MTPRDSQVESLDKYQECAGMSLDEHSGHLNVFDDEKKIVLPLM